MANTIYVLNGPNVDLPGIPEPGAQEPATLADVEELCGDAAGRHGLAVDCRRPGDEGELIDFIREAQAGNAVGIVINAGGCAHTSLALHDALASAQLPAVEVQIGNTHAREKFRHHAFAAKPTLASLSGFGIGGYRLAIDGLAARIGVKAAA